MGGGVEPGMMLSLTYVTPFTGLPNARLKIRKSAKSTAPLASRSNVGSAEPNAPANATKSAKSTRPLPSYFDAETGQRLSRAEALALGAE